MSDLLSLAQSHAEPSAGDDHPDLLHLASGGAMSEDGTHKVPEINIHDKSHPIDDTEHAAGPGAIARASLPPDPQVQIKRYAEAFNQPVSDFDTTAGGHIIRLIPGTKQYARVEPSVSGATGPIDAAKRAFDWVAGGAGPAIPATISGAAATAAAILATPETAGAGAIPAAMVASGAGASAGEIARQKLDAALAPKGEEAPMDYGNVAWQGAAGLTGPLIGKAVETGVPQVAAALAKGGAAEAIPFAGNQAEVGALHEGADAAASSIAPSLTESAGSEAVQQRIKDAAQSYYKKAAAAGVVISPDSFVKFAKDLPSELTGYHPVVNEQGAKLIKMLQIEADNGPMTLDKLDALRSVAGGISAGRDLNEARIAGQIVGKIDDYIDKLKPADLVGDEGANIQGAADALNNARGLWRTYSKLKTINDIVDTGEMLNNQNWVKGRFSALVKSSQFDRFTPDEQAAIASVARTGNLEKAIKLIPWRGLQMASTYAEPFMQDAKVGSVQKIISQGADDILPNASETAIPAPKDRVLSYLPLPVRNALISAGVVGGAEAARPRGRVEVVDVPGLHQQP